MSLPQIQETRFKDFPVFFPGLDGFQDLQKGYLYGVPLTVPGKRF